MTVKTQDLAINASATQVDALVEQMTTLASPPWSRSLERERNIPDPHYRVFAREAGDNLPAACVAMLLSDGMIEVANIVPRDVGYIPPQDYNAILQEFSARLLEPVAEALGLAIVTSLPRTSLRAEMGAEIADRLVCFSGAANKATGSSHPADFKRWAQFLVQAHRSGKRLEADLLAATLGEQGWSDEKVTKLVIEFEFARDLFRVADSVEA